MDESLFYNPKKPPKRRGDTGFGLKPTSLASIFGTKRDIARIIGRELPEEEEREEEE